MKPLGPFLPHLYAARRRIKETKETLPQRRARVIKSCCQSILDFSTNKPDVIYQLKPKKHTMKPKSKIGDHYRQGDVLILYVENLPTNLTPIKRDRGRVILAYGEVTGHSHALEDKHAKSFMSGSEMYLDLEKQSKVWHEDHNPKQDDKPMILPAGKCRIIHQVEFKRKEIVRVAD